MSGVRCAMGLDSMNRLGRILLVAGLVAAIGALTACGDTTQEEMNYPIPPNPHERPRYTNDAPAQSVFGEGGLNLFGGKKGEQGGGGGGIGVNAFLWRASLDTISFLPLTSADPFGGVIITDWYQPPESPNERLKLTIFILGRQLRADGLRVSVFRQVRGDDGNWVDAKVDPKTAGQMEDAILTRARELRLADNASKGS